jgi:hypothetical protein
MAGRAGIGMDPGWQPESGRGLLGEDQLVVPGVAEAVDLVAVAYQQLASTL